MTLDSKRQDRTTLNLRTSVHPEGRFIVACHRPAYRVANLRVRNNACTLGHLPDGRLVDNRRNFPEGPVSVPDADGVYEIANPFPFRGTTYIGKAWADAKHRDPSTICLPSPPGVSMSRWFRRHVGPEMSGADRATALIKTLPEPVQLALAVTSTDPEDLILLAEEAGEFIHDGDTGRPVGLRFTGNADGSPRPKIHNPVLFEAVANNPHLPDAYKETMVLRPGVQGDSEIVGEWATDSGSHVFEYLRRNSYIPWGHYAANMANDTVRYNPGALTPEDMTGMRHLYYQRTYLRLADMLQLAPEGQQRRLRPEELESMRQCILEELGAPGHPGRLPLNSTLWGWNFGFDFAPSRYRLHASHQQVHQQYALIPRHAPVTDAATEEPAMPPAYACGDLIHDFIRTYRDATGVDFFTAYIQAVHGNRRTDGRSDGDADLVVHRDENVMLFVPKAQTSQWELQLVTLAPVGNVLEADETMRESLDQALLIAVQTLGNMGARMITTIEYAKRFDAGDTGQHLMYCFLPRLPESPGAFSEAQLRWINGHYPEDFAAVCRARKPSRPS